MRKIIVSTAAAASILGATAGLTLAPGIAGAQDGTETVEPTVRESSVAEVLDGLVDDGTLTAEQRDAVADALAAARADRVGHRFGDRGGHRFGHLGGEVLEGLGLDAETVRDGIADGLTLGEIADANGSSAEALAEALVEQFESRLDAAVDAGRLDADDAEERRAEIEERVDDLVAGEIELGRRGFRGGFDRGGRFGPPAADDLES